MSGTLSIPRIKQRTVRDLDSWNPRRGGAFIKKKRIEMGLNQIPFAAKAGISQSGLDRLERGQTQDPGVTIMIRIAEVLGISLEELLKNFE